MVAVNQALVLGALHQHELTEAADRLNSLLETEIAERKRAEEQSRRNEVLLAAIIDHCPVGVYVVNDKFELQQVNPTAYPLFEKVRPLIGRNFGEIVRILWPRRVAAEVCAAFRHTLKTGAPYQSPEFSHQRRDLGTEEVYEWQIQRVTLPSGKYGVVCFFNNITRRRKAEAAQRQLDFLTASNLKLQLEIIRREGVERVLQSTEQEQARLLEQSRQQQVQLRDLSHRILHAQEEERKRVSRELHDVIAQSLVGINVHLAALMQEAAASSRSLRQKIARTHRLVEKSVETVHDFAKELRPTILDDLGLIPALRTFILGFTEKTGIEVVFSSFPGIEGSDGSVRTALYRVTQEALTNVARHAKAGKVTVSIRERKGLVCMEIIDDGQGLPVGGPRRGKNNTRLGLLGMKERVEMVGGIFRIESTPAKSTTVRVEISRNTAFNAKPARAKRATKPASSGS